MTELRYNAFDNLLYLSMRHFTKHGTPPRKVSLPFDEARLLIQCEHSGVRTLDELMSKGVAGMAVEVVDDLDARIVFLP